MASEANSLTIPATEHDFDWVVIGSGFGGSVSALRTTRFRHVAVLSGVGVTARSSD